MDEGRRARRDSVFDEALGLPANDRVRFVVDACGADGELARDVLSLLRCHERAGSFLGSPSPLSRAAGELLGGDEPLVATGQLLAGRFRVLSLLARGGMGEVYEALDVELNEPVAIKTIRPELTMDRLAVEHIQRELRLARKVSHPNACRLHDVFHQPREGSDDLVFLTMELLRGESLASRLERDGSIDWREAVPILLQVLAGLEGALSAGVIHRDLKPENIMLVPAEDGLRAVVTDFGLAMPLEGSVEGGARDASACDRSRELSRSAWGTPAYLSPEQLRGEPVTHKSDLFSFGITAYEALSGRHPFPLESGALPLSSRFSTPPPRLRSLVAVPRELERILLDCLSLDPERRPELEEVRKRLQHLPKHHPRRRAVLVALLTAAGGALFLGRRVPGFWTFLKDVPVPQRRPFSDYVQTPRARAAVQEALLQVRRGENLKAIPLLRTALQEEPDSTVAQSLLIEVLLDVGEQGEASLWRERLRSAAGKDDFEGYLARATLARAGSSFAEASEAMCLLADRHRGDPDLLLRCARIVEESGDTARALELYERAGPSSNAAVLGMARCLTTMGEIPEAESLLRKVVESRSSEPEALGMAYSILGVGSKDNGEYQRAVDLFERSRLYREKAGDKRGLVASMSHLGSTYRLLGRLEESIGLLERAVGVSRQLGDRMYESLALHALAMAYDAAGSTADALAVDRESLAIEMDFGSHAEIPVRLNFLAEIQKRRARYGEAEVLVERALEHTGYSKDKVTHEFCLRTLADIHAERGRFDDARNLLLKATDLGDRFGLAGVWTRTDLAILHDARGEYGEAETVGRRALNAVTTAGIVPERAKVESWHALHLFALGVIEEATECWATARRTADELRLWEIKGRLAILEASIRTRKGDLVKAAATLLATLKDAESRDWQWLACNSQVGLGRVYFRQMKWDAAWGVLSRAESRAESAGMLPLAASCNLALAEFFVARKNLHSAIERANMAIGTAQAFQGRPLLRSAHGLLAVAHARLGQQKESLRNTRLETALRKEMVGGVPKRYQESYVRHLSSQQDVS